MSKYLIQDTTLTALADAVRAKTGSTNEMSLEEIISSIDEISGGDTGIEDAMVTGTLTAYTNGRVTSIGNHAFAHCYNLTTISFPVCTNIGNSAFYQCVGLTTISLPVCTTIGDGAFSFCTNLTSVNLPACTEINDRVFYSCTNLTSINLPACTAIPGYAFSNCINLTSINLPACTAIHYGAFENCKNLTSVNLPVCTTIDSSAFFQCNNLINFTLGASSVCTLVSSTAFWNTAITFGAGYIYVPASLVASYQAASNWSYFSNAIKAIGDEVETISIVFYCNGAEYQAEFGMTWAEYCDSGYNTTGFYIDGNFVYDEFGRLITLDMDGDEYATSDTVIENNYSYYAK